MNKKIGLFMTLFKRYAFTLFIIPLLFITHKDAFANFINLSINGIYLKQTTEQSLNTKLIIGGSISLPMSSYFEISLGHNYTLDKYKFNDKYKEILRAKGLPIDNDTQVVQEIKTKDYSANAVMGYFRGSLQPAVFAGAVLKETCNKGTLSPETCAKAVITWNIGAMLSTALNKRVRLQLKYTLSPYSNDLKINEFDDIWKKFDQNFVVGLQYSL